MVHWGQQRPLPETGVLKAAGPRGMDHPKSQWGRVCRAFGTEGQEVPGAAASGHSVVGFHCSKFAVSFLPFTLLLTNCNFTFSKKKEQQKPWESSIKKLLKKCCLDCKAKHS